MVEGEEDFVAMVTKINMTYSNIGWWLDILY